MLAAAVLAYVARLTAVDSETVERARGIWTALWIAVFAVLPPHWLLPDPEVSWLRTVNPRPAALLRRQWFRWSPALALAAVPLLGLPVFDPRPWMLSTAAHVILAVGLGGYALDRTLTTGARAQAWQEGRRGAWLRRMREETGQGLFVPDGLVPTLATTARVVLVGLLGLAALRLGARAYPAAALLPGIALLGWILLASLRRAERFDRTFYAASAIHREIFNAAARSGETADEGLPYEAMYWLPIRLRPPVWMTLAQLDRRLPLGRLVAAGHAVFWVLVLTGAPSTVANGVLLGLLVGQNAAVLLAARPALAPPGFFLTLRSPSGWWLVRTLAALRWALPLALSLAALAFLTDRWTLDVLPVWLALDLALAAAFSALATGSAEIAYRRRYA